MTIGGDVNNSTTSMADVTGLSFAVTNGSTYAFKFYVMFNTAATTTGIALSMNGPTTTLLGWDVFIAAASQTLFYQSRVAYDAGTASPDRGSGSQNVAIIDGIIIPSASGTLIVRFASEVGSSQVTVLAGSSGLLWTIA